MTTGKTYKIEVQVSGKEWDYQKTLCKECGQPKKSKEPHMQFAFKHTAWAQDVDSAIDYAQSVLEDGLYHGPTNEFHVPKSRIKSARVFNVTHPGISTEVSWALADPEIVAEDPRNPNYAGR